MVDDGTILDREYLHPISIVCTMSVKLHISGLIWQEGQSAVFLTFLPNAPPILHSLQLTSHLTRHLPGLVHTPSRFVRLKSQLHTPHTLDPTTE